MMSPSHEKSLACTLIRTVCCNADKYYGSSRCPVDRPMTLSLVSDAALLFLRDLCQEKCARLMAGSDGASRGETFGNRFSDGAGISAVSDHVGLGRDVQELSYCRTCRLGSRWLRPRSLPVSARLPLLHRPL